MLSEVPVTIVRDDGSRLGLVALAEVHGERHDGYFDPETGEGCPPESPQVLVDDARDETGESVWDSLSAEERTRVQEAAFERCDQ